MFQVAVLSVQVLNTGKDHKIVRSVTITAHRVTDSAERRSKHHTRAREDDMPSESKKKTDKSAISEMKAPFCDEITHLLKTAEEKAKLSSASRQVAYSEMTHKLRVRHSKAIIRIIAGSCSHAMRLFLQ